MTGDVLGFSASEVAEMLDVTPASVNSALQRARSGFRPAGERERIALPRSGQEAEVVSRFVQAYEGGDVEGLVALLTEAARVTIPPDPTSSAGGGLSRITSARRWASGAKGSRWSPPETTSQPSATTCPDPIRSI